MRRQFTIFMLCSASVVYSVRAQGRNGGQEIARKPSEGVSATICDIVKDGKAFDGKYVSVHAFVIGGIGHGFALADETCSGGLSMDAPESVREHKDYLAFMRTVVDSGGGFTENSKSRLTAKFYGLLKYHPKEHRKWVLNVERISEVEVKQNVSKPSDR